MLGRGLSWSEVNTWLLHAPVDSAVHALMVKKSEQQQPAPDTPQQQPQRKRKRKQLTASQVRELVSQR